MLHSLQANIVCPNKHTAQAETMYKGHLLESETYIGGKVEALESGVFRSDLPMRFKCKPKAYQVSNSSCDGCLQVKMNGTIAEKYAKCGVIVY